MGSERVPWTVSQSRPPQPLPVRETPRTTTNLTGATSDEELQATLKSAGDRPVCLSRPPSRAVARTSTVTGTHVVQLRICGRGTQHGRLQNLPRRRSAQPLWRVLLFNLSPLKAPSTAEQTRGSG
jgi:hypothetical protein